ncbi:Kinase, NEK [Giardia muris]|uniref:Kinase, NEK n=1 Tax=Giardia muris TaxID=5742 RepID=A0A4Z1SW40_GIAMU|nr:Kinase, NEK [Giardia muris]|eukprot:TNJ29966.1 Kinase, NEK [Giardia muris]
MELTTSMVGTVLPDRYILQKRIATGVVATVYRATDQHSNKLVIVKRISYLGARNVDHEAVRNDISIVSQLDNPHLLRVFDVEQDGRKKQYYIVEELCVSDAQLMVTKNICENRYAPEERIWSILQQALIALKYLHEDIKVVTLSDGTRKSLDTLVHGNIKPSNILIDEDGAIKLGDLYTTKTVARLFSDKVTHQSLQYKAPETLDGQDPIPASDIWSLGAVVYTIATMYSPFGAAERDDVIMRIRRCNYQPITGYSKELCEVISMMLQLDPAKRPTASQLLAHPNVLRGTENFMHFLTASLPMYEISTISPPTHDKNDPISDIRKALENDEHKDPEPPVEISHLGPTHELPILPREGNTDLITAAMNGDATAVKKHLRQAGRKNRAGLTALMAAAFGGHIDCMALLMQKEVQTKMATAKWDYGFNALSWAVIGGHVGAVNELLEKEGGMTSDRGITPLMYAAWWNRTDAASLLISEAGNVDLEGRTALMIAAQRESISVIKIIRSKEIGQRMKSGYWGVGFTALSWATINGCTEAAQLLLDEVGATDETGMTALMYAAWYGRTEIAKMLIEKEAGQRDTYKRTALIIAAQKNSVDIARLVVEKEIGERNVEGRTALMKAAEFNSVSIIPLVLGREAKMTTPLFKVDDLVLHEATALMIAASHGNTDACAQLAPVESGICDTEGYTALMVAAYMGHADCIKVLLNAEVAKQTKTGGTAMMLAAKRNHVACIDLLVDREGGISASNGWGAIVYAAQAGSKDAFRALGPREASQYTKLIKSVAKSGEIRSLLKTYAK